MPSGSHSPEAPVRPNTHIATLRAKSESGAGVASRSEKDEAEELVHRAEELTRRVEELEEKVIRDEGRRPIVSPVPDRPTEEELEEHNATHSPPQPWCPYCVQGTGTREPHRRSRKPVPDVETQLDEVPTISVDFMYLHEKGVHPTLVAVDHG